MVHIVKLHQVQFESLSNRVAHTSKKYISFDPSFHCIIHKWNQTNIPLLLYWQNSPVHQANGRRNYAGTEY
jgi:hypothetical protein